MFAFDNFPENSFNFMFFRHPKDVFLTLLAALWVWQVKKANESKEQKHPRQFRGKYIKILTVMDVSVNSISNFLKNIFKSKTIDS
jgi:hypothetical protein